MDNTPNARTKKTDGGIQYRKVNDVLKVRYRAVHDGRWLMFDPANLTVELNEQPLSCLEELTINITDGGIPRATLTLNLKEIDIDMDTLTALKAMVEAKIERT